MYEDRITIEPRVRWGTPCLGTTGISVAQVVGLVRAGCSTDSILDACPELRAEDIDAAVEWHDRHGDAGLGPRPPSPGERHPSIVVDPAIQGGYPTIGGSRVTVDAVCGLWEDGFSLEQILAEYPVLTATDVRDALDYDFEVGA
jgi:uncharacterized protein (DUF433 family)